MESLLATLAQRASTSTATLGPFAVQSDRSVKLQDTLLKAGSAARVYDSLREAGADSADGPACSPLFRSLPKNGRGNRRCVLHSRRPPSASSWIEVWLVMNEQCRTALLRLSTASVEDALREYPPWGTADTSLEWGEGVVPVCVYIWAERVSRLFAI